jgi:L-rhamnose-H+ transport protein
MNLALGVILHWIGGLAAASFYIPYRAVRRWSWETYWLVGGFFSWIVAPSLIAAVLVPDLYGHIAQAPRSAVLWAYFFGVLWGIGGITFGLTMRYLGIALGMAVALGFCAAFGTLMPPLFAGTFGTLLTTASGLTVLAGVAACLLGIGISGAAGMSKEGELSLEQKAAAVKEFDFKKGMIVAAFAGVMSACFAYGLAAGKPIGEITLTALQSAGGSPLWQNLPVLVVVLWGGFTTNFLWCVALNIRNRSTHQYLNTSRDHLAEMGAVESVMMSDAPEIAAGRARRRAGRGAPGRTRTSPAQLPALRRGGLHLVSAVLLLQHGRDQNGRLHFLQLDAAHGLHYHLQHALGPGPPRVARLEPTDHVPRGPRSLGARRLDRRRRLRRLRRRIGWRPLSGRALVQEVEVWSGAVLFRMLSP